MHFAAPFPSLMDRTSVFPYGFKVVGLWKKSLAAVVEWYCLDLSSSGSESEFVHAWHVLIALQIIYYIHFLQLALAPKRQK